MKYKKDKQYDSYQKEIVKCKCSHSIFLPYYNPVKICSHCGRIVYKNEKAKFIYKLSKKRGLYLG